jgi:hypothetical protein
MITIKGIRTHHTTGESKEVDLTLNLQFDWIHIVKGGVTGYESFEAVQHSTAWNGWPACFGTKGVWDKLEISKEEMQKVKEWWKKE